MNVVKVFEKLKLLFMKQWILGIYSIQPLVISSKSVNGEQKSELSSSDLGALRG